MNTLQYCCCLLLLLLSGNATHAQLVPAGLDAKLSHTLDSMRTVTGAKSFSAAIQFSDNAVWSHADGVSSISPAADVTTADAYLIGSVTKTITSACILQMADQGLLSIDDSVHEWLPTMAHINPDITIRQLLQHTSGLYDVLSNPDHQDSLMADISRRWTPDELIDRFMKPPLFPAGTSWSYSNTNYFLLSMIIKRVTGNTFYTELRNRFYAPLGLSSFAIPAFEPMTAPVAHLWLDITGDMVPDDANDFYMSYMSLNSTAGAAGGYFATPSDCTKWMRKYMRGDILSPAMMAQARTTVPAPASQGGQYGLGLMKNGTNFPGYLAYGHGGDLAYHASSWYFPTLDASITVFTNDNNKNSWALLPVVKELLKTYTNYQPTSIIDPTAQPAADIQAYPNPFSNQFTLSLPQGNMDADITAELKDICGRTIAHHEKKQASGSTVTFDFDQLESLPSGIYFLTATARDQWSKTIKVVK